MVGALIIAIRDAFSWKANWTLGVVPIRADDGPDSEASSRLSGGSGRSGLQPHRGGTGANVSVEAEAAKAARISSDLKFAVLGNCQMGHVVRCLQAMIGGEWPTNEWVNPNLLGEMADGRKDLTAYFDAHDKVFMQPWIWKGMEDRYQHMQHKVVLYPDIHFQGYHPDLVYVSMGSTGALFTGPCGHYHSSIALLAWKAGLSAAETLELYRRDIFRRLGFFEFWKSSCAELRAESQAAGLSLDTLLDGWIERGCFMHSVNHPRLCVTADIVKQLLGRLGIETLPGDRIRYVRDYLADSVVWPVYPEIGESLGIPGNYLFKLTAPGINPDCPIHSLGLEEFVALSFSAFSKYAPHDLVCDRLELPSYRQLLEDLGAPDAAKRLMELRAPASCGSGAAAGTQSGEGELDPLDLAQIEEARTLFKPECVFWHEPA